MIIIYSNIFIIILFIIYLDIFSLTPVKNSQALLSALGKYFSNSLNLESLKELEKTYLKLYMNTQNLYKSIFIICLLSLIVILFSLFKFYSLNLIIVSIVISQILHIKFSISNRKKYLESQIYHFIICLESLCLKNHLPLIPAIKEIQKNSDPEFSSFLISITNQAENTDIYNIHSYIPENINHSKEVKLLLEKINFTNDFSSLKLYFNELKSKLKLDLKMKREELINNIQLYTSIPVISMMLFASYPLYSSILYSMKGIMN